MSEFSRGRWEDWPPAKPIRVEGGIKAKSRRGAIGEQWWSRRFIGVLEASGLSGRLARGRSYARAGQVLDFQLSQGKVTALVQGSRPKPYAVRLGVLPLTKPQWRRVQERLASQALFRAKLLAGEMPYEIEDVFAECGTPLFPRSATDLDMRCTCPDWGVPCKHLAAVCYVLAEEFDRDPFAMLAWRGQARDDLLAALREVRSAARSPAAGPDGPGSGPAARPGARGGGPSGPQTAPLPESPDGFWSAPLSPARLRTLAAPAGPVTPDLLLRMFPPPPVPVRGRDLAEVLGPGYERLAAEGSEHRAAGEIG
jgi:uncharacterized Zn finger protein